jgi:hypothetical protein
MISYLMVVRVESVMGSVGLKKGVLVLVSLLLVLSFMQGALAEDPRSYTVINSKDWRDLYLGTIYASLTDTEFVFFTNLADTQLKTKMMGATDDIVIFESRSSPVVKNYPSLLKVNGYTSYDSLLYDSFHELQELFVESEQKSIAGYVVFESSFGINPVAMAPLLVEENYFPLFLDSQSLRFIQSTTKGKPTSLVGRIPVRLLDQLEGERLTGYSHETLSKATSTVIETFPDAEWGLITRIDLVDLAAIKQPLPVFVYYGNEYLDTLADLIKQTSISKFEVIGGATVDVARALEIRSQRNLNFMLKYGRRVTNYPGQSGEVLDLDSVFFPYPVESLDIVDAVYYEAMGVLAITYHNKGNVDLLHFSNLEFSGSALSDTTTHFILSEEQKTVPFQVEPTTEAMDLTVTTRYGESIPLKFEIGGDKDTFFSQDNVTIVSDYIDQSVVEYVSAEFDSAIGELELSYYNPTTDDVLIYVELLVGEDVVSSPITTILPQQKGVVRIQTPFIPSALVVDQSVDIITYYGHEDTLLFTAASIVPREKRSLGLLTGWVTLDYAEKPVQAGITTLLLLALLFFMWFIWKRQKKEKSKPVSRNTSAKTVATKKRGKQPSRGKTSSSKRS